MTIFNNLQKTHIPIFDIQSFIVNALHGLFFKYDIDHNNSKLEDCSIQV